jgi:hypothetical protein
VEVHSAVAHRHRVGRLKDAEKQSALSRLGVLSRGGRDALPSDTLGDLATRLLDAYEGRAADALQLAAALTWCQERLSRRTFGCADQWLSKSAVAAGSSVIELS